MAREEEDYFVKRMIMHIKETPPHGVHVLNGVEYGEAAPPPKTDVKSNRPQEDN